MGRYTGPKEKLSRREGVELFLKGSRSFSEKAGMKKKAYIPGQHGNKGKVRLSEYGLRMREKQKVKRIYGLREKQFRNVYNEAIRRAGIKKSDKGVEFLVLLETRLDSVVYLGGLASSRSQARQYVTHKHVTVNGNIINVPSYTLKEGDIVEIKNEKIVLQEELFKSPLWLEKSKGKVKVSRMPDRDMIDPGIKENLIIEYYSR